jgi:hypothetical protein
MYLLSSWELLVFVSKKWLPVLAVRRDLVSYRNTDRSGTAGSSGAEMVQKDLKYMEIYGPNTVVALCGTGTRRRARTRG